MIIELFSNKLVPEEDKFHLLNVLSINLQPYTQYISTESEKCKITVCYFVKMSKITETE